MLSPRVKGPECQNRWGMDVDVQGKRVLYALLFTGQKLVGVQILDQGQIQDFPKGRQSSSRIQQSYKDCYLFINKLSLNVQKYN